MENVKIKKSGEAYFVKFPAEISNLKNFIITPVENTLILTPKDSEWANFMQSLDMFSDDIFEDWEENKI
mgnify:CR=1 FL=1